MPDDSPEAAREKWKTLKLKTDTIKSSELYRDILQDPVKRKVARSVFRMMTYSRLFFTISGWSMLSKKSAREFLFTTRGRTGLLEDALLGAKVHYPASETHGLTVLEGAAGHYSAYDHRRKIEFGTREPDTKTGRLYAFVLDELKDVPKSAYTPSGIICPHDLAHILCLDMPSIDDLVQEGFVEPTTYETAYRKLQLYDRYADSLAILGIAQDPILQVTPKGNGLIFLGKEGGKKEKFWLADLVPKTQES